MNQPEKNELLEKALRGRLTAEENAGFEQELAADPAFHALYEEERALDQLLEALPVPAVSSNFTARVLQEALRETGRKTAAPSRPWFRWGWRRALATAAVVLAGGGFIWEQQQQAAREEMAESLTHFSKVTAAFAEAAATAEEPEEAQRPVSMLQDFQAIQHLAYMPAEQEQDLELYLALHK